MPDFKPTAEAIVNIFETGRVRGRYGAVTVLKGDTGHLSYGRSQASLGSGSLYLLLKAYCESSDARFRDGLRPYLSKLQQKDASLDFDPALRSLLEQAGDDPAMQKTQDDFFDRAYWNPAVTHAKACGLNDPLSIAVIYDSHIQGGFAHVRSLVPQGPCVTPACDEVAWITAYIDARRAWLKSCGDPLPNTVYRVNEFSKLVGKNQQLALPIVVRGVRIDAETLGYHDDAGEVPARVPDAATSRPILELTRPYMRGEHVRALKAALALRGFTGDSDDIFGPLTAVLVRQFQAKMNLTSDGVVGPLTWQALETPAAAAAP